MMRAYFSSRFKIRSNSVAQAFAFSELEEVTNSNNVKWDDTLAWREILIFDIRNERERVFVCLVHFVCFLYVYKMREIRVIKSYQKEGKRLETITLHS